MYTYCIKYLTICIKHFLNKRHRQRKKEFTTIYNLLTNTQFINER